MKRVKDSASSLHTAKYKAQDEAWGCVREKTHKGNSPLRRELTLTNGNLTEPNLASPKLLQLCSTSPALISVVMKMPAPLAENSLRGSRPNDTMAPSGSLGHHRLTMVLGALASPVF